MTATPRDESGWTIETYSAYNEALRVAQEKFEEERDRRYREVEAARTEALRVREESNKEALRLAHVSQDYRDERDNRLREQLNQERGSYATHEELSGAINRFEATLEALENHYEAAHKPLADYITAQIGRQEGIDTGTKILYSILVLAVTIITAVFLYIHHA